MTKSFWESKLKAFLDEKKGLEPKTYGLRDRISVVFWIEGGLKIAGNSETLALNMKDSDLLILSTLIQKTVRSYRIPYSRIVCFEIVHKPRGGQESAPHDPRFFSLN